MGSGAEGRMEDMKGAVFSVTSKGLTRGQERTSPQSFHRYLIPCELRWELPVEQIILVQAETFVDQSVLRGRGGGRRGMRK